MADTITLLQVSAFSGLAGALFTQLITAINNYFVDKRKQSFEVSSQYRAKKTEIGENFYYISGEKLAAINKNISFWKNWNNSRTEAVLDFLKRETQKFNTYMETLNADNWKFNLINLYFSTSFTSESVRITNERSQKLFLQYLDLGTRINEATGNDKELLYQKYAQTIFDMCSHYEQIALALQNDMDSVRIELLNQYKVKV